MRFPSLKVLMSEAGRTLRSYPLVLLFAATAAVAALALVDVSKNDTLNRLLLSAQLGIPLFFAVTIFGRRLDPPIRRTIEVGCVALLAAYFFSITPRMETITATRFIQFNIGTHLLVAFLPFARLPGVGGFWQYNRTLFLRFLLSALYSHVLFAGLAVALLAIDNLFGVDIDGETYMRLWIVIVFVFNTWFFVGGVPRDTTHFENLHDYPTGLKVFTQYVLVPLVIIYLLILTTYLGKVLVTRQWPSGWIGYLVSSVSAVGILAMLLVHPIKDSAGNAWVRSFSRWFYVFLLPSIGMLFIAIFKRIAQYGITEKRYFLLVLTFWLAGTAIYFIVSRSKNIKSIPLTLCLLAFATAFGPWGAFSVSELSQVQRLHGLLEKNDLIENNLVVAAQGEVSFEDRKEMSAVLNYLSSTHGLRAIRDWFDPPLTVIDTVHSEDGRYHGLAVARAKAVMDSLGLQYVERWASVDQESYNIGTSGKTRTHAIEGYQYHCRLSRHSPWDGAVTIGDGEYSIVYEQDTRQIAFRREGETLVTAPLDPVVENLLTGRIAPMARDVDADLLRTTGEQDGYRLLVYFTQLSGARKEGGYDVQYFEADCFIVLP